MLEIFSMIQSEYLQESQQFEPQSSENENLQRKIKRATEIMIIIERGTIFKEFIDCYRHGYFN